MSDHRATAQRLLLTYLNRAATSSDLPFRGDDSVEIQRIVDEIIDAVGDEIAAHVVEFEKAIDAAQQRWREYAHRAGAEVTKGLPALTASLDGLEKRHDALEIRFTRIVELEGKVDHLEERRRENDRDRIAMNGLRLAIDKLTDGIAQVLARVDAPRGTVR